MKYQFRTTAPLFVLFLLALVSLACSLPGMQPPTAIPTIAPTVENPPVAKWVNDGYSVNNQLVFTVSSYTGSCENGRKFETWKQVQATPEYTVEIEFSYRKVSDESDELATWIEMRINNQIVIKELKDGVAIGNAIVCVKDGQIYSIP